MIKWTTPSLKCTIPEGIDFDKILLTVSQGNTIVEKEVTEVTDNSFTVFFTQEETSQFSLGLRAKAQLNIMYGNTRLATNIIELEITPNLHDSVIEL